MSSLDAAEEMLDYMSLFHKMISECCDNIKKSDLKGNVNYINGNREIDTTNNFLYWNGKLSGLEDVIKSLGFKITYKYDRFYKEFESIKYDPTDRQERI